LLVVVVFAQYFALSLFAIAQGGGHLSAPADHVLDLQMAISGSNLVRHIPGSLSPEIFAVRIDAGLVYWQAFMTPSPFSVDVNLVQEDSLPSPVLVSHEDLWYGGCLGRRGPRISRFC
jgi:hypothetical protein